MERVSTLLKKLQQQLDAGSPAQVMLQTVQLLQAELCNKLDKKKDFTDTKIAVVMPAAFVSLAREAQPAAEEEKIIEVLQVDEKAIEEELEQIKRNAEMANALGAHGRPGFSYNAIEEIPTLAHQDYLPKNKMAAAGSSMEYHEPESLNDRLKENKTELSQALTAAPIKDLKKAIGVNDRFLFMNELFRGDEAMYERSIKTIQNFSNYAEAEFWIRRELKVKIGWTENDPIVKQFDLLVKRRFS